MRRICLMRLMKRLVATIAAGLAAVGSVAALSTHAGPLAIGLAGGATMLLLWIYWTRWPREEYRDYHGQHFVPAAVGAFGGYDYDPKGRMPSLWTGRSGLIPEHDIYATRDLVSTERDGVVVQFAQAELRRFGTYPSHYGETTGAAPGLAFRGLLILLSLDTSFTGRTLLVPDRGALLNLFSDVPGDLNVVRPALATRAGRYEILSTDADEARRLLDADIVESVVKLASSLGGGRMRISFYDAQILVMVPLKTDLFRAPSIFRRPAPDATAARLLQRLRTIESIAEALHRRAAELR